MKIEELFEKLDINGAADLRDSEAFCGMMELEEELPEALFFQLMGELSFDEIRELADTYLEEMMSGVPEDCIDFYTFLSSYRRNFKGMICCFREEENLNAVIGELYRFREWYRHPEGVQCTDLLDRRDFIASVFDALVLGRMEKLSVGSYSFDFGNAMEYEYDDYEDFVEEDAEAEFREMDETDPSVTLVDRENPVIDGENYDDYEGDAWLQ